MTNNNVSALKKTTTFSCQTCCRDIAPESSSQALRSEMVYIASQYMEVTGVGKVLFASEQQPGVWQIQITVPDEQGQTSAVSKVELKVIKQEIRLNAKSADTGG